MVPRNSGARRPGSNLGRKSKNTFTTKSGKEIKINRSLISRLKARKAANEQKRAERLAGMPKSRVKRFFYRLHPKRMYRYWFSREGMIMALKITGIGILAGFLFLIGVFAYFRKDLPNITDFSGNNIGGSIQYFDKTGKILLWEDFDAVKRIPVPGDQISDNIKKAMIAIEDQDFFEHGGFDVRGIARAGVRNVLGHTGDTREGGSTITQQLVRLTQPEVGSEQTYSRKLKELILSVELEREYSKEQILTGYLNVAPFGNIEYGVEAAANDYFDKSAKDLSIAEAAFLAAIPKSPSIYSPYGPYFDKEALIGRQHYILDLMVQQQMISQEDSEKAKKINILKKVHKQQAKYTGIKHPYFALAAKSEIETRFGSSSANRGGWKVITTLDESLQKLAEKAVKDNVPNINRYGANVSAFVAQEVETGQIVALVGGTNFNNKEYGKINYAHDAYIPPGSTFKPYDYAALIEYSDNVGAGSVLYDSKTPLPGYPCTNKGLPPPRGQGNCLQDYDFRTPGPLTLRYALGGSRNITAVKANLIVGTDKVIEMASKMMYNVSDMENGRRSYNCYADELFEETTQCYGASAIGDGAFLHLDDHVNGFGTFSRLGKAIPKTYILKITDASEKAIYEYEKPEGEQVIRPDTAYIVNDMASDPKASYLPFGFYKFHDYKGWDFAIKTGTTNNGFDGLMAAWSAKYATISWVGHHTRNVELGGFMEYMTTPITKTWMEGAHDKAGDPIKWQKPEGLKTDDAFVIRTHVGIGSVEPSASKDLYPSWYKPPAGTANSNQKIDIVSNKLATECTPARAIKSAFGANSNIFSVDTFVDAPSATTKEKDDVHACGDKKPSVTLTPASYLCNGSCSISATVHEGTHPLDSERFRGTVNLIVDGKVVGTKIIKGPQTVSFKYTPNFSGTKTLKVEVIDSVLYEGSATGDITSSNGSGGDGLRITEAKEQGAVNTKISWTGGTGIVRIYKVSAGSDQEICSGGSEGNCSPNQVIVNEGDEIYAKDENGESEHVTVDD
jgi:membrane peptidoglycan carboxypeptidase